VSRPPLRHLLSETSAAGLFRTGGAFAIVDAVGKGLAFAVVAVLTRQETPHTFGVIVAGMAGASIVQTVADGGLALVLARAVAKSDPRSTEVSASKVAIAIAIFLPATGIALTATDPVSVVAASCASGAASALPPVGALLAAQKLRAAGAALVGPNVLFLAAIAVFPITNAAKVLLLFAGSNAFVGSLTLIPREVRPKLVSLRRAARLYAEHIANGVFTVTTMIYGRIDTVILAAIGSAAVAGLYGTYFRLVLAAVGFFSWLTPLAFSSLSDWSTLQSRIRWLERRLLVPALTVTVLLSLVGPVALRLLTHHGHLPVATILLVSALAIPTILSAPLGGALIMNDRSRALAQAALVVLVVSLVSYATLIPDLGSTGAALASFVGELVGLAWLWREVLVKPPRRHP
jgi:O-antigen/teichoic acid export membrane protein